MSASVFSPLLAEIGAEMRQSIRAPEFLIPTIALPVIFYLMFGVMLARGGTEGSTYLLATYGIFAVMGPALFGFGAGVAAEREKGWLRIKRVSPAPATGYIVAKLTSTLVFSCLALMPIYLSAGLLANVALPTQVWLVLLASHLLAAIPFSLLGLSIGFSFGSGGAVAVANLCFLGLAVLGGLWFPVMLFPGFLKTIATALPSFHLAEISLDIVNADSARPVARHLSVVAVTTLALAALAVWRWISQR
ncbi:MAG: ABC transporter permease [Pseudomonadota bacterium]